ncbi:hypothetical protein ACH9L7_20290 (plasmid) [Haloferax sp. S1W]|uniref:hypothetical protein n=1 Tax=Haloferax sp. S1W TaxID=3377110 RepID=UPI0037CC5179
MATFGFYIKAAATLILSVLLQDLLETVIDPLLGPACGPSRATEAVVEGAQNCLYVQQGVTWFIALVVVGLFITAVTRGALLGGVSP